MGRQWLHAKRAIVNLKKGQMVGKIVKEINTKRFFNARNIEFKVTHHLHNDGFSKHIILTEN